MVDEFATIRAKAEKVKQMVEKTALAGGGDPFHSDVYLNIDDGVVRMIVGSNGNSVLSYCTFTESYLEDIDVNRDAVPEDDTAEAIIDVGDFLSYLDFAADTGFVDLTFKGGEGDRLASLMEADGSLSTRVYLPASESLLQEVPTELPTRFDEDDHFTSGQSGEAMPVEIHTDSKEIARIVEIVEYDPNVDFYPISIEDEEMQLDIGTEENRNAVYGSLPAESVVGPDLTNYYHQGFPELFNSLQGNVWLQTAPDAPVVAIQDHDSYTLRHVIGHVER